MNRITLSFAFFFLLSCGTTNLRKRELVTVEGRLVYEEGNRMLGVEITEAAGVKREVSVFSLLNLNSLNGNIIPFDKINNIPIITVVTDDNGNFKIRLEEGKYSLLIKEKEGYFVPLFDKENNLNPIIVERGKTNLGTYVINYTAYY